MRPPFIIGLDVDEVLARLHAPWIEWGNRIFGTNHKEFRSWGDPQEWWGAPGENFLSAHIYDDNIVKPYEGALAAVNALRAKGHGIRFVSHAVPGTESAKFGWLVRHGFLLDSEEYVPGKDKSRAPCHVLVDDGYHNVVSFQGWAILVTRSHNRNELWWGHRVNHIESLLNIL